MMWWRKLARGCLEALIHSYKKKSKRITININNFLFWLSFTDAFGLDLAESLFIARAFYSSSHLPPSRAQPIFIKSLHTYPWLLSFPYLPRPASWLWAPSSIWWLVSPWSWSHCWDFPCCQTLKLGRAVWLFQAGDVNCWGAVPKTPWELSFRCSRSFPLINR